MKLLFTLFPLLLLTACSNTRQVGKIGCTEIHVVHGRHLDGPNFSALYESGPDGSDPRLVGFATGPGIGAAIVGAGGNVGAAALFGQKIRPSVINNNSSGANASLRSTASNANDNANTANGGNAEGGAGGNSEGGFVPPGHINNPGHSK